MEEEEKPFWMRPECPTRSRHDEWLQWRITELEKKVDDLQMKIKELIGSNLVS